MESVKVLSFHIQGTVPTLMHNGRLADPLDEKSILLKEITGKRKKTEADQMEMPERPGGKITADPLNHETDRDQPDGHDEWGGTPPSHRDE